MRRTKRGRGREHTWNTRRPGTTSGLDSASRSNGCNRDEGTKEKERSHSQQMYEKNTLDTRIHLTSDYRRERAREVRFRNPPACLARSTHRVPTRCAQLAPPQRLHLCFTVLPYRHTCCICTNKKKEQNSGASRNMNHNVNDQQVSGIRCLCLLEESRRNLLSLDHNTLAAAASTSPHRPGGAPRCPDTRDT